MKKILVLGNPFEIGMVINEPEFKKLVDMGKLTVAYGQNDETTKVFLREFFDDRECLRHRYTNDDTLRDVIRSLF